MPLTLANQVVAKKTSGAVTVWTPPNILSPTANRLYLALVANISLVSLPTGITGCGLTWVPISSVTNLFGTGVNLFLFRALKPSGVSAGTLSVSFSDTITSAELIVDEAAGIDTSGTNGSGAIVQFVAATRSLASSLSIPLGAFVYPTAGAAYGAFVVDASVGFTADTGYTKLNEVAAIPSIFSEWKLGEDLSVVAQWNANKYSGGIAVELKPAGHAPTVLGQASEGGETSAGVVPRIHGRLPILQQSELNIAQSMAALLSGTPPRRITRTLTPATNTAGALSPTADTANSLEILPYIEPC